MLPELDLRSSELFDGNMEGDDDDDGDLERGDMLWGEWTDPLLLLLLPSRVGE